MVISQKKKNSQNKKPFRFQMDLSKTQEPIHKNDHTQHEPGWTHANINTECFKSLQNRPRISFYEEDAGSMEDVTGWRSNKRAPASTGLAQKCPLGHLSKQVLAQKPETQYRRPRLKNTRFRNCLSTLERSWPADSLFWPNFCALRNTSCHLGRKNRK